MRSVTIVPAVALALVLTACGDKAPAPAASSAGNAVPAATPAPAMAIDPPPKTVTAPAGPQYLETSLLCETGTPVVQTYRLFPDGSYVTFSVPRVDGKPVEALSAFHGGTYFLADDVFQTTARLVALAQSDRWARIPRPYVQRHRIKEHNRTTFTFEAYEGGVEGSPLVPEGFKATTCTALPAAAQKFADKLALLRQEGDPAILAAGFTPTARERVGLGTAPVTTPVTAAPPVAAPPAGSLPQFAEMEDYGTVRARLLLEGWTPLTLPDAEPCGNGDERCAGRPEVIACAGSGLAFCKFAWRRDGQDIVVYTSGEGREPGVREITPARP